MAKEKVQPQQNPTQLLDEMLAEKLLKTNFTIGDEHRKHIAFIQQQLANGNLSITDLCDNRATFEHLIELPIEGEITLLDASMFLNSFSRIKPTSMGLDIREYLNILAKNDEVAIEWNTVVMPMKTSLMREIEAKFARNIIIPKPNFKIHK